MLKKIKNIKSIDMVYLGVLLVITLITTVFFFVSVKSIAKSINKIFVQPEANNIQVLDQEKYSLLEKKLNLLKTKEAPAPVTQSPKKQ